MQFDSHSAERSSRPLSPHSFPATTMTKKADQEKGDYSCLKGKEGKDYAAECTFEELLEATGAANQQLLEKALERNNIHHIKGFSGVKARSNALRARGRPSFAHSSRACRRRLRARRSSPSARGRRCRRGAEEERDGRARRRERTAERNLNKSARPAAPRPAVVQYTYNSSTPSPSAAAARRSCAERSLEGAHFQARSTVASVRARIARFRPQPCSGRAAGHWL